MRSALPRPAARSALPRPAARAALAASVLLLAATLLPGCAPAEAQGGPGGPPPVGVVPAVARAVPPGETFTARLEAIETVEVRPQVTGTLQRVHFREGQAVRRGELLFTIDPRPFAAEVARAEAQLAAAGTQGELARAEVARAEKLLPIQAASQQEIDQLRAGVKGADANAAAARAALDSARLALAYTRIAAPIAGRVGKAEVTAGNLVAAGSSLLTTLVGTGRVRATVDVNEAAYLRFVRGAGGASGGGTAGTAGTVQVAMGLADEPGFPHAGRIDFVDNRLNPATGTIRVRAVFDDPQGRFTPGLSARVRLSGAAGAPSVLVPERAIGTDQTNKVLLIVGANNVVAPRPVQTGPLVGGMRVVSGVKAGELVIVDGLQRAFPGAPVAPQRLPTDAEGLPLPAPPPGAPPAGGGGGAGSGGAASAPAGKS
jgi:RND family efflux transporter MFP subunit